MAIKLSNERLEEIKKIIVNMLIQYGVSCVPINGFEIATKMGVKVISYSAFTESRRVFLMKKSEDGFSAEKNKDEWYIYYNDEKDYGRINNTIMHEIGHIILDHSEDNELAEKEVKFVAKYTLAPPVLIHKLELDNPYDISNIFEISLEAAGYAHSYYQKWLKYGSSNYTGYELHLLELFKDAI